MPQVLAFTEPTHKLVPPVISEGLADGVTVRLWIRRTGAADRRKIVEFASNDGSLISLGTSQIADSLVLSASFKGVGKAIAVEGGLPADRWVMVEACIRADGNATLAVFGREVAAGALLKPGAMPRVLTIAGDFDGELSGLQIWRAPASAANADSLWADYPLTGTAVVAGTNGQKDSFVAEDTSPNQRHAVASVRPATVLREDSLAEGAAAVLQLKGDGDGALLSPITGLSRQLTFEAWIRPDTDELCEIVAVPGLMRRLALVAGGPNGVASLRLGDTVLCSAPGAVKKGEWTHIAATLDIRSGTAALHVMGQVRDRDEAPKDGAVAMANWQQRRVALVSSVGSDFTREIVVGGTGGGRPRFRGAMAEVRVWRTADSKRVMSMWLTRARGDEPELAACYRFDALSGQTAIDISATRGSARVATGVIASIDGLPICSTSRIRSVRVSGRGKLVREPLPASAFVQVKTAKLSLDIGGAIEDAFGAIAGQVTTPSREASVFDATIEVQTSDGAATSGRSLAIRVDRPVVALVGDPLAPTAARWDAGRNYVVALPSSGRVRLRFLANHFACPTIRVRLAGAAHDIWSFVRPDEPVQIALRRVNGQNLLSPKGRRSPMPAGSSDKDAEALATAMRQLASVFNLEATKPVAKAPIGAQPKISLGDVGDFLEDTGGTIVEVGSDIGGAISSGTTDLLNGAKRTAKSAGKLISRATGDVEALWAKASKATAMIGREAIGKCIGAADSLAVIANSPKDTAAKWIEVVGTAIIDGSEVVWRVIVASVEDAMAAIAALIERIAGAVAKFIEFLAFLFAWGDFLETSDRFYKQLDEGIGQVKAEIAGARKYEDTVNSALRRPIEQAVGRRSIGDLCGLDVDEVRPALEQLDWFLEQFDTIMGSAKRTVSGGSDLLSAAIARPNDADSLSASAGAVAGSFPRDVLDSPATLLSTPVADLLAGNDKLADGSSSLTSALFGLMADAAETTVSAAGDLAKCRLEVPWLTDMIEDIVLDGRKLNMLRVVSMIAAIGSVLTDKLEGDWSPPSSSTRTLVVKKSGGTTRRRDDLLWITAACGLVISSTIIAQTVREYGESESSAKQGGKQFMQMTIGFFTCLRGFFTLFRVDRMPAKTRLFARGNAVLDLCVGGWMMASVRLAEEWPDGVAKADFAMQFAFGFATAGVSTAALVTGELDGDREITSFSLRCASWIGSSFMRISEKADDKDESGRVKAFTIGLSVAVAAIDISEAIYGNVGEVSAQTG